MLPSLLAAIDRLPAPTGRPLLVAVDGRGGAGKSTLCAAVTSRRQGSVIDTDDFYAGHLDWSAVRPAERADRCIDAARLRAALLDLRGGRAASWCPYDWDIDDGRRLPELRTCAPSVPLILVEGTFSGRAELADCFDLRVLLRVDAATQRRQFIARESEPDWLEWVSVWGAAEDHYFEQLAPPRCFGLVLQRATVA